jgi:hypothetical protein
MVEAIDSEISFAFPSIHSNGVEAALMGIRGFESYFHKLVTIYFTQLRTDNIQPILRREIDVRIGDECSIRITNIDCRIPKLGRPQDYPYITRVVGYPVRGIPELKVKTVVQVSVPRPGLGWRRVGHTPPLPLRRDAASGCDRCHARREPLYQSADLLLPQKPPYAQYRYNYHQGTARNWELRQPHGPILANDPPPCNIGQSNKRGKRTVINLHSDRGCSQTDG